MNHIKTNQGIKAKFTAGHVIKVRSRQEISYNNDSFDRLGGVLMISQIWEYCGQNFRIFKVLNNFLDKYRYKTYKARTPLYILEGLICNGEVKSFEHRCDRSCYLLWHEDWLEKS